MKYCYRLFFSIGKLRDLDAYTSNLCQVLKDHKCDECIRITRLSHHNMVRDAVHRQSGVVLHTVDIKEGSDYSFKPAQLVLSKNVDTEIYKEIISGLEQMRHISLDLKVIDKTNSKLLFLFIYRVEYFIRYCRGWYI